MYVETFNYKHYTNIIQTLQIEGNLKLLLQRLYSFKITLYT